MRRPFGKTATAVVAGVVVATLVGAPTLAQTARSVSVSANKDLVSFGGAVVLSGQVTSETPECRDDVPFTVQENVADDLVEDWRVVSHGRTLPGGAFSDIVMPRRETAYRVDVAASDACSQATSDPVGVKVRAKVVLAPRSVVVPRGDKVTLVASVKPMCFVEGSEEDVPVHLQRFVKGRFIDVASAPVSDECKARFQFPIRKVNEVFQARVDAIQSLHFRFEGGTSRRIAIYGPR